MWLFNKSEITWSAVDILQLRQNKHLLWLVKPAKREFMKLKEKHYLLQYNKNKGYRRQGADLWWITHAWVLFYQSKMEISCYLESPTPKKSVCAEETKIYYTFLLSPRIDKDTGQNFLQWNPYFVNTSCYLW